MPEISTLSELYPREWLSAADLGGRRVRVTIAAIEVRAFRRQSGGEESAVVLSFVAHGKPCARRMVCNRTQARAIAEITGSEVFKAWIGTQIELAPTTAPNGKATIAVLPAAKEKTDGKHADTDTQPEDHARAAGAARGAAADGVQADGAGAEDRVPPLDDL